MERGDFTRRDFIRTLGLGTLSITLSGCAGDSQPPEADAPKKKPNILFLFTDDQRFDTIHALGNEHIITPNMDSLVRTGTTFTNAYIMGGQNGAICMPSRAMLMTGRTLFRLLDQGRDIPEEHAMLPEVLRNAGYATFHTGKWHNGKSAFARSFTHGAKIMFGGMSDHYNIPHHDFDPTGEYPNESRYKTSEKHSSELYADTSIRFLQGDRGDKPFFMYVSFQAPHDPRDMPKDYLDMYDPEKIPLPENFMPEHPFDNGEIFIRDEMLEKFPRTPKAIRGHIAAYYAMITHADAQIGRILDTLKETGEYDNTIIVFAGDNGLAVGQHGLLGKQNVYEHSVHVPLIMCGPGIPKGEKRDEFCYLSDIFPTLCDLAGIPVPSSVEGITLAETIREGTRNIRDSLFFVYKNFQRSVRTGRWKLIYYNVNGKKKTQLFDLKNDPWETTNLAEDPGQTDRIFELTGMMKEWFVKTGDKVDLDKPDWGVPAILSRKNM